FAGDGLGIFPHAVHRHGKRAVECNRSIEDDGKDAAGFPYVQYCVEPGYGLSARHPQRRQAGYIQGDSFHRDAGLLEKIDLLMQQVATHAHGEHFGFTFYFPDYGMVDDEILDRYRQIWLQLERHRGRDLAASFEWDSQRANDAVLTTYAKHIELW